MRTSSSVTTNSSDRESGLPTNPDRTALALSILVGAALGVGLGFFSMAGWIAPVIGLVVGAVAGGLIGRTTLARSHRQAARDRVLDREIGLIP